MKLPLTCPNSSDSSRVSGIPAQLTVTSARSDAGALAVEGGGDELLADAALAGDEHLRVRARDAIDFFAELPHGDAAADQMSKAVVSQVVPSCLVVVSS